MSSDPTSAPSSPTFGPPTPAERAGIEATVAKYAQGLADGDVATLMQAFDDNAVVCGYVGDEGFMKPVTYLYRFILQNGAGKPSYRWHLGDIVVSGRVAIATVYEEQYLGDDYVTSLHLIKIDDLDEGERWWIVSKLFRGTPST